MYRAKTVSRLTRLLLLVIAALVLSGLAGCHSNRVWQQRFLQFGTIIDISLVDTDERHAEQVFSEIGQLLETRHHQWHGWEDGTLSRFNHALAQQPAEGVPIPPVLDLLITQSKKYYRLSQGRFNPAMGRLIAAWGFHDHSAADPITIALIKQNIPGMDDLAIRQQRAFSSNPHLQLDFGAIAKGLGVSQIAQLIRQQQIKDFIINAGGDVYAEGQKPGAAWNIAIQSPFDETVLGSIQTDAAVSVFTSGNYRRFYQDDNHKKRHHIIDPKTGEPSTSISAITLLHADPLIADVAATTLMLTEPAELKQMAATLEVEDYLAITQQRELFISQSMLNKIQWHEPHGLQLHIL
ncbi:MAG: FAD:protein FMN transferase [Gammaproteobacteria bacterium]|nr:FAD:protein FMN transferase [Gammaproteobacteria bacterium]MBL7000038.1 FAD:protein FMN transferase [Gammaproteobacteria bacterium]